MGLHHAFDESVETRPYKGRVYEYVRLRWRSVRDPSGGVVASADALTVATWRRRDRASHSELAG